jgi:hypothetical protein
VSSPLSTLEGWKLVLYSFIPDFFLLVPDPDLKAINLDQLHWQKPVVFPDASDATLF